MAEQNDRLLTFGEVQKAVEVKDKMELRRLIIAQDAKTARMVAEEIEQLFEPNKLQGLGHEGLWEFGRIIFNPNCKHCRWQALKDKYVGGK